MEALGSTANLNQLPVKLQSQGINVPHKLEDMYDHTKEHMITVWCIMSMFAVISSVMTRFILSIGLKSGEE